MSLTREERDTLKSDAEAGFRQNSTPFSTNQVHSLTILLLLELLERSDGNPQFVSAPESWMHG